jgi:hypothetical protein
MCHVVLGSIFTVVSTVSSNSMQLPVIELQSVDCHKK